MISRLSARAKLLSVFGLVLVVAVLLVGIVAATRPAVRDDGPLQPNSKTLVEFSLTSDETASWGVDVPRNDTDSDIVFRSAELVGPEGFAVLGVSMNRPNTGSIVNAPGYPPPGVEVVPVEGSTLPPGGSVMVVVGVQIAEGMTEGSIEGLRVRYAVDGQEYDVMLEYGLRITLKPG